MCFGEIVVAHLALNNFISGQDIWTEHFNSILNCVNEAENINVESKAKNHNLTPFKINVMNQVKAD